MNLDGMGVDYSYSHAAALAVQLPRGSRVVKAESPETEWDDATYLLSAIEYDLRVLAWQNTKDAQRNRNKPKPNETPSDLAKKRRRAASFDRDFVDRVMGKEAD